MLVRILNSLSSQARQIVLLAAVILAFSACAKEKPPLIADESAQRESTIPWNEKEDWESEGQFGGLSNSMDGR